jgi:hypothetical protein
MLKVSVYFTTATIAAVFYQVAGMLREYEYQVSGGLLGLS